MLYSKRQARKFLRGKGQVAMRMANWPTGLTAAEWAERHDPLYRVKGAERHRRSLAR